MTPARVAFFTDSFHEVNGVALTSRQFAAYARRNNLPFFSVHAGPEARAHKDGSVVNFELARSNASFNLESTSDLSFDPLLFRNGPSLLEALKHFRPNAIHITGPGDFGILGAWAAGKLGIPLVASWHTNVHEYAGLRLEKLLAFLPDDSLRTVSGIAQRQTLAGAARFYRMARLLFAPNQELVDLLSERTGKPCFLMQRGVDAVAFHPGKRSAGERPFTIGYVGRLSVEKNIRFFARIEKALIERGINNFRFLIVGSGGDQEWLRQNLDNAVFPGVLKGEALAQAYADMDVFAFPSHTDTFGNVILEALASGAPPVVTTGGGPKFLVQSGRTGFIAATDEEFCNRIIELAGNSGQRSQMGLAARAYACSISWDSVFDGVYRAYERILFPEMSFGVAS